MRKFVVSLVGCSVLFASACTYETKNYYGAGGSSGTGGSAGTGSDVGGSAGSAGTSNQAGAGGVAGSAGEAGSAGQTGVGGTTSDGGAAGQAGEAGAGGAAGMAGYGGTQSGPVIKAHTSVGYENPDPQIVVPTPNSMAGATIGYGEILLENDADSVPIRIAGARVCQVNPEGDAADFDHISLNWASHEIVASDVRDGECWDLTPTGLNYVLPVGIGNLIWTTVQVAEPLSTGTANGAWHGVPRSGHVSTLRLTELRLESLDGQASLVLSPNHESPALTLRAGMPYFSQIDVPLPLLIEGAENVIHRVRASVYRKVGLRHLEIYLEKHGNFTVTGFKLERCDSSFSTCQAVPSDQVAISIYDDMVHGALGHMLPQDDGATINVEFLKEETLDADAYYQVKAVPWGTTSGDTLETYYWQSLNQGVVTGQLGPMSYGNYTLRVNGNDTIGTVIWTDLSEGSDHDPSILGSTDYTNDFQIYFGYSSLDPITTLTAL